MKWILLITICLTLSVDLGCTENSAPSVDINSLNQAVNKSNPKTVTEVILSPPDLSMTDEEYIKAGIPSYDREWSSSDLMAAAKVLASIAQVDLSRLPRYQSQKSGRLFDRISADENLNFCRDRSLSISHRFPAALEYIQATSQISKIYLEGVNSHKAGTSDLIELSGAILRVSLVLMQLTHEFVPTLDKNDPTYPVRMEGLKRTRGGLATIVTSSLQTLTESPMYSTAELKRLISYLRMTLPGLYPELLPGTQAEVLARLQAFTEDPKMKPLWPEIMDLLRNVKNGMKQ